MKPIASRYTVFEIPKKSGGSRTIKAPDEKLKLVQTKLSVLLQDCLDEINASNGTKNTIVHGFMRKRSIITNAKWHRNRRWVFNLDLQDFFPTIHFGRVRGFFIKDRNFALHEDVATVLAQIACDGNALPQGGPCSPVISNFVAHSLDMHLFRLAAKVGCSYTRYADDLTFSTNKKEFPKEIALENEHEPHMWKLGPELQELIKHSDFQVNEKKTRMLYRDSRQEVTGLIVNRMVNVRKEYRHDVRAMVHRLFRTGAYQLLGFTKGDVPAFEMRDGTLDELHGRLGFIDGIDRHNQALVAGKGNTKNTLAKEAMFRRFLIYRDFYTAEKPVILCEGKTDNIYIKHAIRSLAAQVPDLAEIDAGGKVRLKVRLYKYAKSSTGRILRLKDGGAGNLKNFITTYKNDTDKFSAPGLSMPLIVLFDNDSAGKDIRSAAKESRPNKAAIDQSEPFARVIKNLYILPTPLSTDQKESKIEDFFDQPTKAKVISGKTFSDKNEHDDEQHYGKWTFAQQVIVPHANTIDFSGFLPLLNNISALIQSHAKAAVPPANPNKQTEPAD